MSSPVMLNLPVLSSAGVPGNLGTGTNEDRVLALRTDDIRFYEDVPRFRVFEEVLSSTLQTRWQIYNYVALAVRYASAISVISGTGLVAPAGF